jgi:hypothetical protein
MAVIRVEKNKNYTVMANIHLRDRNLSLKAKGLLSVMLSLPDNWNYSVKGLCAICKENETAINSALKELKTYRYVIMQKKPPNKDEGRSKFEYIYYVYEEPQDIETLGVENLGVENGGLNKYTDEEYNNFKEKEITENINMLQSHKMGTGDKQLENRFIPVDYTENQLIEHIQKPLTDYCIENGYEDTETRVQNATDIIVDFYRQYYNHYRTKHRILSDKAYVNIMDAYCNPPEVISEINAELKDYQTMAKVYFKTDYNARGNYDGKVTKSISHFMTDMVQENLYYRVLY